MLPLLAILPNTCFNIGGLALGAVRLWPAKNVASYPEPVGCRISQELALFDPNNYADVYFLDGTGGYDEDPAENEQGTYYKVKLGFVVAGDAPDVSEAVARLAGGRCLVAFQDANGLTKLAGTPEWPLRLLIGTETGKKPGDRNGLPFTFSGELPERAPFYLEQNIPTPGARRAWSSGFTIDFS